MEGGLCSALDRAGRRYASAVDLRQSANRLIPRKGPIYDLALLVIRIVQSGNNKTG